MPGSLISGFLPGRWRGNVPDIPVACATRNFMYLVRGPWYYTEFSDIDIVFEIYIYMYRYINFWIRPWWMLFSNVLSLQSGDFPSQSPPFRGAKYRTSPVRQVRHTASCGFMVDPCGAPWWPLRCSCLDALSAPYVYVVIIPNMPSHIPTEWDHLHTKHSISLQSLGPSE